jgi:hypothetical protein
MGFGATGAAAVGDRLAISGAVAGLDEVVVGVRRAGGLALEDGLVVLGVVAVGEEGLDAAG